jgi:exodeoxyribonuclease VII large subunit
LENYPRVPGIDSQTSDPPLVYGPAALLNAIGNTLSTPLFNRIFVVRGLYKLGKGVNYNGAYYDILKDEYSDSNLTLVVPERWRTQLKDAQVIEASVYLSKRFQPATGRIDLLLTINELLSRKEKPVNQEETRAFALLQQKAKTGYKDADAFLRKRLYEQKPVRITLLIGHAAIIDQDIQHQLREAVVAYELTYVRINMAQPAEIARALQAQDGAEILVVARGGGDNLQVFDNPTLGETALGLRSIFMTALGHSVDDPLLQKLADRSFITPTALGQYFHDLYNKTLEDLNDSKAKLIGDLSRQIELSFQHKLQDLQLRLAEVTRSGQEASKANQDSIRDAGRELQVLANRLARSRSRSYVLVMAVIGLLLLLLYFGLVRR